mgnify:CR=1 FL=1
MHDVETTVIYHELTVRNKQKDLIVNKYTLKEWESTCPEAKVGADFIMYKTYEDKVLVDIIVAASKVHIPLTRQEFNALRKKKEG